MEAPEYFDGGYCRGGNPQFATDIHGKVAGAGGDHFIVEDLLDFSNEDDAFGAGDDGGFDVAVNSTDDSTLTAVDSSSNSSFSGSGPHFARDHGSGSFADAGLPNDLCVPYDELAELEWLSNLAEESFSSEDLQKLQLISGVKSSSSSSEIRGEISTVEGRPTQTTLFSSETPVPGKARSKRSRHGPCSWSSRLLVLSPTTTSSESEVVIPLSASNSATRKTPKPVKQKDSSDGPAPASDGRKCLHCATDKTPQWRTGPMGPKTLCNACGVRYKSGRLVPEYRPAASPTFVLSKHSNSHRKVLEMRRQKELHQHTNSQLLHPAAVYEAAAGGAADEFLIHHRVGHDFRHLI